MTDNLICLSCEHYDSYDSSDSNSGLCTLKTEVAVPTQTCINHSLIEEKYPNASLFLKILYLKITSSISLKISFKESKMK